jgi:hypothetical protein
LKKMRWTKRPGLRLHLLHQRLQRIQRLLPHDPERQWWAAVVPKAAVVAVRPAEDAVVVTAVPRQTERQDHLPCAPGRNHYHDECPKLWGGAGTPLPGFAADGQSIAADWHKTENEPLRRVIRAWVSFLKDFRKFSNQAPAPAGVSGAPNLAAFEARELVAPKKP